MANDDTLNSLSDDVGSLWCGRVPILDSPPSSFIFLRDYVNPSRPCIIRGAIPSDASRAWKPTASRPQHDDSNDFLYTTLDDLVELSKTTEEELILTVDITPDGHGDTVRSAITCENQNNTNPSRRFMFVKPEQRRLSIASFRTQLRQHQTKNNNDCSIPAPSHSKLQSFPLLKNKAKPPVKNNQELKEVHRKTSPKKSTDFPVLYYSMQNNCLRTELKPLFSLNLFPHSFPFAEEAFDTGPPDAINLWIGNERSVSAMHKDHYENLFYVLSGEKVFTICPPADIPFLYEGDFDSGTFKFINNDEKNSDTQSTLESQYSNGYWTIVPDEEDNDKNEIKNQVKWIEPDITDFKENQTESSKYPLLAHAHPSEIRVKAGEMLYLPSLWFHRVTQTCETVGINYWYDMKFDSKWCYFNFLQNVSSKKTSNANK